MPGGLFFANDQRWRVRYIRGPLKQEIMQTEPGQSAKNPDRP